MTQCRDEAGDVGFCPVMISTCADPADPQTAAAGKTTVWVIMNLNWIADDVRNVD